MNNLLSCVDLCKSYIEGNAQTEVLKNINLTIYPQELISIIGSSGSGKSTLLHLLAGLDIPTSGEIFFKEKSLNKLSNQKKAKFRNKEIGFIYQFHHLLPDFSAMENIAMPLLIGGIAPKKAELKAQEMLEKIGLSHRIHHRPSELSGGERQRVAIGRALINSPSLVMADEPTGNLDETNAEKVFDLLLHLNRTEKTTFLVVTHDIKLAKRLNRQLMMKNGKLHDFKGEFV